MGPQSPSNDGLTATSSELNIGKDIDEREDPPIASGSGGMPTTAQTGAHEQESKLKIGNRPFRLICLLCLVTSALILIVIGLSIHVSQIRQSQTALDQNCHELNSTLQAKVSEISHLNHSEKTCLKNLTALKTNLSVLVRMHNDLRHQITEIKTKLRSVKNSMAQICEFLISRREERCPRNWTESADRCYFISTLEKSYDAARNHCSNVDASLLEINSNKEKPSRCCGWKQLRRWVQAFKSRVHKLLSSLGGKSHASS
ncbi:oxidized low-density lipoprotein receptor 1-like [Mobula birostris]|uniref:oxidized low-density lipoprotein receptor 1-like n=1 Tax=Mobula birostris TaxID=1983395 RepID=UPI003B288725